MPLLSDTVSQQNKLLLRQIPQAKIRFVRQRMIHMEHHTGGKLLDIYNHKLRLRDKQTASRLREAQALRCLGYFEPLVVSFPVAYGLF